MPKLAKLAALTVIAGVALAAVVNPVAASGKTKAPVLKMLWHQEFNGKAGTGPSTSIFNYDLGGGGWGNQEHEAYVDDHATLDGSKQGNLVISATRYTPNLNDIYYTCPIDTQGSACEFLSSRIQTQGNLQFQYGQLSARIKVPSGDGVWPAFWLLGNDISTNAWPNCGEIDIMEARGDQYPANVFGTAHGPGYSGADGIVNTATSKSPLSAGYHIFTVVWQKNKIQWLLDGKVYNTVTPAIVGAGKEYVFNKPFFLILNLAMGGNFVGGPVDPTLNSADMSIDWIRYYSYNGVGKVTGTKAAIKAGKP
ncbi:MAG: family 16 glycosylhydrolase [Micrococcales bacterium]